MVKRTIAAVVAVILLGFGVAPTWATVYVPLQTFNDDAGKWLCGDLGWVKFRGDSGDIQVSSDTALTNPAIDGSTRTGSFAGVKKPFTPAAGNEVYVLSCKAVGGNSDISNGVFGFEWLGGWWWNGTWGGGGWSLDLRAFGGGAVVYGLTGTAGQVVTLILVIDQVHMQAWGVIKQGETVLCVTPKSTITSAAIDGVLVGTQDDAGLDVDDILLDNNVPTITYLPKQSFDGDAGKWLFADLGWTQLYSGDTHNDLQVTNNTILTNPAIEGGTFGPVGGAPSQAALKKPFTPAAAGSPTYVLTCKAVGRNTWSSSGVVGFGWLAGWWWSGQSQGWSLDLRALGGGNASYGLTDTAGRAVTLTLVIDAANLQAWGVIKDGDTIRCVTPKSTITSAAVDGVVVGCQSEQGLDVDDIVVDDAIPVITNSGATYLPLQSFDGDAGKWLCADLGWIQLYSSDPKNDLQVTNNTLLTNPAIEGSTFAPDPVFGPSQAALKKPFTPAPGIATYVLTCKAVGAGSYGQGVVGFAWLGGWWWNGAAQSGWILDLRAFGGTNVAYGLNETAGRVVTLQLVVDQLNMQAWGVIKDGDTTLLMTPKTAITSAAVDGVLVGSQTQEGLDIDEIVVDGNVPLEPVMALTFTPDGGSYPYTTSPKIVTIDCATPGAVIHYTTDGSDPTESSDTYSGPITVDHNLTLKSRAWASGYAPSPIKSATYAFVFTQATISQCTLAIDGSLSDWPAVDWSTPFVFWNGAGPSLNSTTKAKFAWSAAQNVLYVAVQTNESVQQPGGHLVIGLTKDNTSVPTSGIGSTQLCFDTQSGNDVWIRNEIQYYKDLGMEEWGGGGTNGVEAKYDNASGTYTYEVAVPLWTDWRLGQMTTRETLLPGDTIYVYVVMEDRLTGANGTDLSYYGNPAFYNGANASPNAWTRATALTLQPYAHTSADLAAMLAAMDARKDVDVNYNPLVDLDGDGEITSTDLSFLLTKLE